MDRTEYGADTYRLIAVEVETWRAVSGDLDDFIYYENDQGAHSER